jgi:hypothetical protein
LAAGDADEYRNKHVDQTGNHPADKATFSAPKLARLLSRMMGKNFVQAQAWASANQPEQFQRIAMARRTIDEMQGRLPLAR